MSDQVGGRSIPPWQGRFAEPIKGVVIGLQVAGAAVCLAHWNEGRAAAAAIAVGAYAFDPANTVAWALRGASFVLMVIGFMIVVRPLVTVADVVPFVRTPLSAGAGTVAFSLALSVSLVTIAVSWVAVRPLLGGALLIAALGVISVFWMRVRRSRAASARTALPQHPS